MKFTQAGLRASMDPKTHYYHSDGTGRDTYVAKINGGLLSQDQLHNIKLQTIKQNSFRKFNFSQGLQRNRNPEALENKVTHYHSDGSGRDSYITINEGGRSTNYNWKHATDHFFQSNLRTYSKLPSINTDMTKSTIGFCVTPDMWMTPKDIQKQTMIGRSQAVLTRRLSQPKQIRRPPKMNFNPFLSPKNKQQQMLQQLKQQ